MRPLMPTHLSHVPSTNSASQQKCSESEPCPRSHKSGHQTAGTGASWLAGQDAGPGQPGQPGQPGSSTLSRDLRTGAESLGDLYQVQMVKNNSLNIFLDTWEPKTFLSPGQPYLRGELGSKSKSFLAELLSQTSACPSSDVRSLTAPSEAE